MNEQVNEWTSFPLWASVLESVKGEEQSLAPHFPSLKTKHFSFLIIRIIHIQPWLVWLSGLSTSLGAKGLLVRFPVGAHAYVVGQVPSWMHSRGNCTLMFLSLSCSLPSPL